MDLLASPVDGFPQKYCPTLKNILNILNNNLH